MATSDSTSDSAGMAQMSTDIAVMPLPQLLQAYVDDLVTAVYRKEYHTYAPVDRILAKAAKQDVCDNVILKALATFPRRHGDRGYREEDTISYERGKFRTLLTNRLLRLFRPETTQLVQFVSDGANVAGSVPKHGGPDIHKLYATAAVHTKVAADIRFWLCKSMWWSVVADRKCTNYRICQTDDGKLCLQLPLAYRLDQHQLEELNKHGHVFIHLIVSGQTDDLGITDVPTILGYTAGASVCSHIYVECEFTDGRVVDAAV